MSALRRIDPTAVMRLARSDLPGPLDVLNLIELRDERSYARYAIAVTPAMLAVGARLRWMGRRARALCGNPRAERVLIVRYRSHRRFLAMTLNPYYVAINEFRERGVRAFEAAFTYADREPLELNRQRWLTIVQFDDARSLDELQALIEPQSGPLVYASRMVASANYLRGARPTDPAPLRLPCTACFAASEDTTLEEPLPDGMVAGLYQRSHPRALVELARARPQR